MEHPRFYFVCFSSIILCAILTCSACFASVDLNVGVKVGDWMEYGVSYVGLPELGASFFGYEIIKVDNSVLTILGTTNYSNGTIETENYTVDIFKHSFRDFDGFIIPTPISEGWSSFFSGDENRSDLIVDSFESREYAGVMRDVVVVNFSMDDGSSVYVYDVSFGVLVEYQRFESEYSLDVKLEKTNLWTPGIFGFDPIYFLLIFVFLIIVVVFLILRKRRKEP